MYGKERETIYERERTLGVTILYMIIDGGVGGLEDVFRLRMHIFVEELIEQRRRRSSSSIGASHWTPILGGW